LIFARTIGWLIFLAAALLLEACGGSSGDQVNPLVPPAPETLALSDPNSFLVLPNPQRKGLTDSSSQLLSLAYAQAYYATVDPDNKRDTLAKWKKENGFDSGTGVQRTVVFGDTRDLGYGRRLTAHYHPTDCNAPVAVLVENYLVDTSGDYAYSQLSLDAAVVQDKRWHLGTYAIEFSQGPSGRRFTKFFAFDANSGARTLTIDLDGRGDKPIPGPCITCHAGRGDALRPAADKLGPPFPGIASSPTRQVGDVLTVNGDVFAHLQPLEADGFDFSSTPGFTRADQEAAIKVVNKMILSTYPIAAATAFEEDRCRAVVAGNEWQGTAANLIKNAYGGDSLPNANFADTYVPAGWAGAGQTMLYQKVVVPYCRGCHLLLGSASQSDLDFESFDKFQGFADRTKVHVIDRGNMPLARIIYDAFIADTAGVEQLATFLEGQGETVRDGNGRVLRPGRPVADPGPNRVVRQGATTLSAGMSLYASSYRWSIVSGPAGATLNNANTEQPTFSATADGTYVLQLIATGNGIDSASAQLTIVVNNALAPAPSAIRFADIRAVIQAPACSGCHSLPGFGGPPIVFTNIDRNGDGIAGDATDDLYLYTEVRSRINFTDIVASPLLRKPAGYHHFVLPVRASFDTSTPPGNAARANYDLFLNWILNDAPL
jgi:hypothetical protein